MYFALSVQGRGWSDFLPAPVAEADRHHNIGAAGKRLLPRAANRERIFFRYRALARAPRIYRDAGQLNELLDLRAGLRPEEPVAARDDRALRRMQQLERLVDMRWLALA